MKATAFDARRWRVILGGSVAALAFGAPAFAQTTTEAARSSAQAQPQGDEDGEVVVTARRREENLQSVPLSVTSISGDQLSSAHATSTYDLSRLTPGLNFVSNAQTAQPNIRGVGSTNGSFGDEANVAIYVDGIYQPNAFGNVFSYGDVARIEVLKGPQGTLFGRNSTGGAINITTRGPSDVASFDGSATFGEYGHVVGSAFMTGPIAPNFAASLAVDYSRDDGYKRDIVRNVMMGAGEEVNARAKLLWSLGSDTDITLGLSYRFSSNPAGNITTPLNGNINTRALGLPYGQGPYESAFTFESTNKFQTWQEYLRIDHDFGGFHFSSQTSASQGLLRGFVDTDFTQLNTTAVLQRSDVPNLQQEFLLTSNPDSRIQWVAGLFGYHARGGYQPRDLIGPAGRISHTVNRMETTSFAPFGEVTIPLVGDFSVTGGLRYTWERRSLEGAQNVGVSPHVDTEKTWTQLTPRVVLQYERPDFINIYASYSEGFKSGVYNTSTNSPTPVNPEHLRAYEVGVKTLGSSAWRGSLSVYHYDYRDIQVFALTLPTTALLNAAEAEVTGAEAQLNVRLAEGLRLNLGAAYQDGTYTRFTNAVVAVPNAAGAGNVTLVGVDVSGNPLVRTPEWTVSAGIQYDRDFAAGDLEFDVGYYYNSGYSWDFRNRVRQGAFSLVNATLGWTPNDSPVQFAVWGTNLTDERYTQSVLELGQGDMASFNRPRTLGVRVSYNR